MPLHERSTPYGSWSCFKINLAIVGSLFIIARFIIRQEEDCIRSLLSTKHFESEQALWRGCALRNYTERGIDNCFSILKQMRRNEKSNFRKIAFVGDQEMKEFYEAFVHQMPGQKKVYAASTVHEDKIVEFRDLQLRIEYIPQSVPDSSLKQTLMGLKETNSHTDMVILGFEPFRDSSNIDDSINLYTNNVSALAFNLDLVSESTKLLWWLTSNGSRKLDDASYRRYKSKLHDVLKGTHARLWERSNQTETHYQFETQVLVNYFCNFLQVGASNLCCSPIDYVDVEIKVFIVIFVLVGILALAAFLVAAYWKICLKLTLDAYEKSKAQLQTLFNDTETIPLQDPSLEEKMEVSEKLCYNYVPLITKCFVIFSYFFICDRTSLFNKENKSFTYESFYIPLAMCTVLSLLYRGNSGSSKLLNREITDEWKGWMQVVILIYHFTGASSKLHIYMHLRILVSSYLFMTGYGNFCYYWQGGTLNFRRYCQVMLRMNLLTILLCIVMNKSYQFYYFVPLVSFWHTVLFLIFLLPPKLNLNVNGKRFPSDRDYINMVIKLVLFFASVVALSLLKKVFDAIFLLPYWQFLFVLPGYADYEWWFRWNLDRFTIIYGAAFGLIYKRLTQSSSSEDGKSVEKHEKQSFIRIILQTFLGIGMIASYSFVFMVCSSKEECNAIHPFISWIPILGYILLRNMSETLRSCYSVVMVNAGKISLELFVCQYHIWLAADTKGILVLLPWASPAINGIVVSVLFATVAYEVHHITAEITGLIVAKDNKRIVINLILLSLGLFLLKMAL